MYVTSFPFYLILFSYLSPESCWLTNVCYLFSRSSTCLCQRFYIYDTWLVFIYSTLVTASYPSPFFTTDDQSAYAQRIVNLPLKICFKDGAKKPTESDLYMMCGSLPSARSFEKNNNKQTKQKNPQKLIRKPTRLTQMEWVRVGGVSWVWVGLRTKHTTMIYSQFLELPLPLSGYSMCQSGMGNHSYRRKRSYI